MPIPQTRNELIDLVESSFNKLWAELESAGPEIAGFHCVDEWNVKDLLAVRVWWSHSVIDWVEAGMRGEQPVTPAEGYRWKETPRLNADLVKASAKDPYETLCSQLRVGYKRVIETIDELDDHQLLDIGVYRWAGNYPISRWISINTARQYTTARTFIRRALRTS